MLSKSVQFKIPKLCIPQFFNFIGSSSGVSQAPIQVPITKSADLPMKKGILPPNSVPDRPERPGWYSSLNCWRRMVPRKLTGNFGEGTTKPQHD